MRRALIAGAVVWALAGGAIASSALHEVNDDARAVVALLSLAGPAAALLAAMALATGRSRLAGILLLASVVTPTYFSWVVNLPALVVGLALVAGGPGTRAADGGGGVTEGTVDVPCGSVTPPG